MINHFLALIVGSTMVLVVALALATAPDKPGVLRDDPVLLGALRK